MESSKHDWTLSGTATDPSKFFLFKIVCLGQTVIPLFSSSGTSNLPALLRIKSASGIFEPVALRLLPKPRLTRSLLQDSNGQILKPTPSAPQGESTDQKEHFRSVAEPNALQIVALSIVCYVTNIPEVPFGNQASLAVTSFAGI